MRTPFEIPPNYRRHIGSRFLDSLDRYFNERIETGGWLRAVLENDLRGTLKRGDPLALEELPFIVDLLLEAAPSTAWGSKDAVEAWLKNEQA